MKTKPIGYLFNGKYYKSLDDLRGKTMSEDHEPIPLHSKQQIMEAWAKGNQEKIRWYNPKEVAEQYYNQTYKDDE